MYYYLVFYDYEIYNVNILVGVNVVVSVSTKNYHLEFNMNEEKLTICLGNFIYEIRDTYEINDFLDDVETLLTKGKILHEEASKILNVAPIFKGEER